MKVNLFLLRWQLYTNYNQPDWHFHELAPKMLDQFTQNHVLFCVENRPDNMITTHYFFFDLFTASSKNITIILSLEMLLPVYSCTLVLLSYSTHVKLRWDLTNSNVRSKTLIWSRTRLRWSICSRSISCVRKTHRCDLHVIHSFVRNSVLKLSSWCFKFFGDLNVEHI